MDWRTSPLIEAWWGEGRHPLVGLLRMPLLPFSLLFACGVALRGAAYAHGVLPVTRLPTPVISVGNLTAGGTGKTPMVRHLARYVVESGRRPLVFSSGFGARPEGSHLDEEGAALVRAVPGVRVLQGSHPAAALAAATHAPDRPDIVILDDGFQKRGVARDLDIVMVDATRPFGSGFPLPAGPLREGRGALKRAGVIVLTRVEMVPPGEAEATARTLRADFPNAIVLRQRHEPASLLFSARAPGTLRGATVFLLSAIAHPRAFEAAVTAVGARIAGHLAQRDHAPLPASVVADARARARAAGASVLLCTAKDAPKVAALAVGDPPLDALDVGVRFDDDPAPLFRLVDKLLEQPAHGITARQA